MLNTATSYSDERYSSAKALIQRIENAGIRLRADGDSIVCNGRKNLLTAELRAIVAKHKPALLQYLQNGASADSVVVSRTSPAVDSGDDSEVIGSQLSFSQERLWLADQLETDRVQFLIPYTVRVRGEVNRTALSQSLSEIVRRHQVLRTNFPVNNGRPTRIVSPKINDLYTEIDLSREYKSTGDEAAIKFVQEIKYKGLDVVQGPVFQTWLVKLEQNHHVLFFLWHHIVFDGYSLQIFLKEFDQLYSAFDQNEESPLSPIAVQYDVIARRQRKNLGFGGREQQLAYWRKQLKGASTFELPRDTNFRAQRTSKGNTLSIRLSESLGKALTELSRNEQSTLFMTLFAGFSLLLSRHTNREDVVIGSPVAGRTDADSFDLIGCFLNSLVLRSDLSGNPTFKELLRRVKEVCLNGFDAQDVPFEAILNDLQPERVAGRTPLFQIFFNMQYGEESKLALPNLRLEPFRVKHGSAKFDLTLYVVAGSKGINITASYNAGLYSDGRMFEFLQQYELLLNQIAENPDSEIAEFTLRTANATAILPDPAHPLDKAWPGPVHEIFSANAALHPHKVALIDATGETSYEQLDKMSNGLANWLIEQNLSKGDVVAIFAHRSSALVWAILSVMKTGASFLIIDLTYPAERNLAYLGASSARAVLTLSESGPVSDEVNEWIDNSTVQIRIELPEISKCTRFLDKLGVDTSAPHRKIVASDAAYVAFTSGSTGKPKGIIGAQSSLTHFESWMCARFELTLEDRVSMLSGLAHDPLHRDVFSTLCRGATIVIPDSTLITGFRLAEWAHENAINVLVLTPAMARILTSVPVGFVINSVRQIFLVGEELTSDTVADLFRVCPETNVVNLYGSTETQRAVAFYEVPRKGWHNSRIPVGRGMKDVQLLVLNKADLLCGMYEIGELCIRSPHLAIGYLANEASTSERFVRNPFVLETGNETSVDRMYRTGDFGYYNMNGDVIFEGRTDGQISIRGFRIERAEIESALRSYTGVSYAAVGFRSDSTGAQSVVAYVVPVSEGELLIPSLMSFMKEKLPRYMVPTSVVQLDRLPVSPNGKIMYDQLPAPQNIRNMFGGDFIEPRTSVESNLATIWSEILARETVGVEDDFFDLGGHSMLALRLSDKIARAFGVVLSLIDLFGATTIESQADLLEARLSLSSTTSETARTTKNVSNTASDSKKDRPNLFLIPGLGGYGVVFSDLTAYLNEDLNVHAVSAPGLDGGSGPLETMTELAKHYIRKIKQIQPEGPYNLVGFSFGGQVAYEIAQQLQQDGCGIAYLAALDSMPPMSLQHLGTVRKFLRIARFHMLNGPARLRRRIRLRLISGNQKSVSIGYPRTVSTDDFVNTGLDDDSFVDNMSSRLRKTIAAHQNAVRSYQPAPYPGSMVLIRSSIQRKRLHKSRWYSLRQWADFVQDLQVVEVQGTHNDIIKEPKAAALAAVIVEGLSA